MKSHFMAAPTREEMGVVGNQTETSACGQKLNALSVTGRPPLTPEQEARLAVVMSRSARGGGHLTDGRHLAEMPNYRPLTESACEEQTVIAQTYYVG